MSQLGAVQRSPMRQVLAALRWLWRFAAGGDDQELGIRVFRLLTFAAGVLMWGLALPLNMLQGLPWHSDIVPVLFGGACLWLFWESHRHRQHLKTFILSVLVSWQLAFVADAGLLGTAPLYGFIAIALIVVLLDGWLRTLFVALALAALASMFALELWLPGAIVGYADTAIRLSDQAVGYVVSGVGGVLLFGLVIDSYERERARMNEANRALTQSIAELETLRGLLPFCPRCRKVRDVRGYWLDIERYLAQQTGMRVSHGLCRDCQREHFGDDDESARQTI